MEEENPRLRKYSHIGLWFTVIIIGGWLTWSATHSRNKTETFATGSKQTNTYKITKNYGLAFLDLALMPLNMRGCTRADKLEEVQEATNEEVDAKKITGNAISDNN